MQLLLFTDDRFTRARHCRVLNQIQHFSDLQIVVISSANAIARCPSSVCPSIRLSVNFAQIATSTTEMAGSPPNLHTMVPTRARIQGVLKVKVKVKGHVIRTLFWLHENRFFYTTNTTGSPPNLHTMVHTWACIQGMLKVKVKVKGHVIRTLF